MRTAALITGIIFVFISILALMFRIMHWPFSGIGTILGVSLFSAVYLPLLLGYNLQRKAPPLMNFAYALGTLAGMALFPGMMFIIMHWSGGSLLLTTGIILTAVFLGVFILGLVRDKDAPRFTAYTIINFMMLLVLFLSMKMSTDRSRKIEQKIAEYKLLLKEQEHLLEEIALLDETAQATDSTGKMDTILFLNVQEFTFRCEQMADQIHDAEGQTIMQTERNYRGGPINLDTIPVENLVSLTNSDIPSWFLVGADPENPVGEGVILLGFLRQWKQYMIENGIPDSLIRTDLTETVDLQGKHTSWVAEKFYDKMLIDDMIELEKLRNDVIRAEKEILIYLLNKDKGAAT